MLLISAGERDFRHTRLNMAINKKKKKTNTPTYQHSGAFALILLSQLRKLLLVHYGGAAMVLNRGVSCVAAMVAEKLATLKVV